MRASKPFRFSEPFRHFGSIMKFGFFLRMVGHITEPSGGLGKNATAQATTTAKPTPNTKQEARMKKKRLEYKTN